MSGMSEEIPETTQEKIVAPQESLTYAGPIVATYGRYYRNTRYLMFALFLGFGIYCIYDGFYKYPRDNESAIKRGQPAPHGEYDAPLNKALGIILPPLAIFVLYRALRSSRGEYRLEAETLHIPGHPPVPLSAIRTIDKKLWDRKGIAYIQYELPGQTERGRFTLDDFVYEREPIDKIMERIEAYAVSVQQGA
jgi:hypothetical protein